MKHLSKIFSLALVAFFALSVLSACATSDPSLTPTFPDTVASAKGLTYISLRINPEIELVADENGEIVAVNAVNEDGELVLSQTELVGMDAAQAAETFTETATELGYVDPQSEDTTVYVDVQGEDSEAVEQVRNKLSEKILHYFNNNGIGGKVCAETLEQYAEAVADWGVSAGHAKIILRVLDLYPEMSAEEVLALDVSACIALIKEKPEKSDLKAVQEQFKQASAEIREKYAELDELETQLKEMETALEGDTLTEQEKAALDQEYEALRARCEQLRAAYREELSACKASYREQIATAKQQAKKAAAARRGKDAEKIEKYLEKASQRNKNTAEAVTEAPPEE